MATTPGGVAGLVAVMACGATADVDCTAAELLGAAVTEVSAVGGVWLGVLLESPGAQLFSSRVVALDRTVLTGARALIGAGVLARRVGP